MMKITDEMINAFIVKASLGPAGMRECVKAGLQAALSASPAGVGVETEPTRAEIDAYLQEACGKGIPYAEATDHASMMHGLAYILRQIEGTSSYKVNIGQTGPATSSLRMALDHFARAALKGDE